MGETETIDLTFDGSDDVYIIDEKPPSKRVKLEDSGDSDSSSQALAESVAAPTSAYSEIAGVPSTLMALVEGRGVASEIAYCLFNLVTSQCTLAQFSDGASYSRTIYALITARPQVVLAPRAMADGKSKAMLSIRRYMPWMVVVPLERKWFNDGRGAAVLRTIALPDQYVQLERALHTKHYAYAALNALFHHLEHDLEAVVASGSVHVACKQMEGAMQIDPGAWRDLGLEYNSDSSGSSKGDRSLLQALDHTHTKMGGRLLRANILQPLTDLCTIYARQGAVLEMLDNEELFFFLSARLAEVPDIDSAIAALVRCPAATTSRQVSQAITNVLHVKHILQLTAHLARSFTRAPRSGLLDSIVGVLSDPRNDDLLQHIHSVVREDITHERTAWMGFWTYASIHSRGIFDKVTQEVVNLVEQYAGSYKCNEIQVPIKAVYRPNAGYMMSARRDALGESIPEEFVNVAVKKSTVVFATLDLASIIKLNNRLASVVTEINLLTEKYAVPPRGRGWGGPSPFNIADSTKGLECRAMQGVANTIRGNISVMYRVSEAVALLDMLVSFAHHCTLHECVVPEFSDAIEIVDGRHPILEELGHEVVPNSTSTTTATFTVVSGPNMGGKSTYMRQIIYLVIMAQIGSLVPAQSATLKVFSKLFVRMNNNDSTPTSESSFLREMHDIAYMLQSYDGHSLVVVDELGRSTAAAEGKAICRAVCEELVDSAATVFLTTHFLELPGILGEHPNCAQVVLSQTTSDGRSGGRFRATSGVQPEAMYGIRLAEKMGFPSAAIEVAKDVAKEASWKNVAVG
ncbi:MutS protein msh4 [Coemansia spiralis]|nr:MutS protein msh4 [Coemansia spiralis]